MKRDYCIYLKDILCSMESIEDFIAGTDFEKFKADDKTASAVVRKFEIIGEATKHPGRNSTKIPADSMAGNGRNERQVNPLLFWD